MKSVNPIEVESTTSTRMAAGDPLAVVAREVRALARSRNPESVSWRGVRRAVLAAADFLRLKAEATRPPIDLKRVRTLRRIRRVTFFAIDNSPEAVLVPARGGFTLKLRPGLPTARYRFSVAHEIGHTLFYDLSADPPTRPFAWNPGGSFSKEENICNAFARELLMPRDLVVAETRRLNASQKGYLALVHKLATAFKVSDEVAAIRVLRDLTGLETAVVLFRQLGKNGTAQLRRYWGKYVGTPRMKEKEIIEATTGALRAGDQESLRQLREEFVGTASIEWRCDSGDRPFVALLSLVRERKST